MNLKHSTFFFGLLMLLLVTFAAVLIGADDTGTIDSAIYDALESEDEARIIVILEEDIVVEEILEMDVEERAEEVADLQSEFLEELASEVEVFGDSGNEEIELLEDSIETLEVEEIVEAVDDGFIILTETEEELLEEIQEAEVVVIREFEQTSAIALEIDDSDVLDELVATGKVAEVLLDERVSVDLETSVPLINANDVWEYESSGSGSGLSMTGFGETICVIDTGIDYTHSALGGCNPVNYTVSGNEETLSTAVESDHPYSNSIDVTYTINMSGYENIAVHFVNISLEEIKDRK